MLKKRWRLIRQKFIGFAQKTHPPGLEGESLYDVGRFFVRSFDEGLEMRAAGVTFRFLLALFPLIVSFFSIIPFIPIENFQEDILLYIYTFLPDQVYEFIEPALSELILRTRPVLLSIGFLVTIYFASSGFGALFEAFSHSYQDAVKRNMYKRALISMSMIFIMIILVSVLTIVAGFGQIAINYMLHRHWISGDISYWSLTILQYLIIIFLYLTVISILYNLGHTSRTKWTFFSAGSTSAVVLIIILQEFYSLYLSRFASFDELYGPLGAIIGFLLFFYYLFLILIIGFELNAAIHKSRKSREIT